MLIIGLTGGIASGKSTVSKILESLGMNIIDADIIAKEVVNNDKVKEKIIGAFGRDIYNSEGALNRKMLGSIVFGDKKKLIQLNEITHPAIKEEIKNRLAYNKNAGIKVSVIDAALLIEDNYMDMVDIVILVYVPEYIQIDRIMKRDNLSETEAKERISSQMPFEVKKRHSNYIIDNSYSIEHTKEQINKILSDIKSFS